MNTTPNSQQQPRNRMAASVVAAALVATGAFGLGLFVSRQSSPAEDIPAVVTEQAAPLTTGQTPAPTTTTGVEQPAPVEISEQPEAPTTTAVEPETPIVPIIKPPQLIAAEGTGPLFPSIPVASEAAFLPGLPCEALPPWIPKPRHCD